MNWKRYLLIGIIMLLAISFMTACTTTSTAVSADSAADGHSDGHDGMDHMHVDPPDEFANLANPFADDHEAMEAGKKIFQTNCAACHGETGMGDGPAAETLDPKPAALGDGEMMAMVNDGYLFWRVSKGGMIEPFNSVMPAWEAGLTEDQRWQVISYVRSLSGEDGHHMEDDHHADDHGDDVHEDDHSG